MRNEAPLSFGYLRAGRGLFLVRNCVVLGCGGWGCEGSARGMQVKKSEFDEFLTVGSPTGPEPQPIGHRKSSVLHNLSVFHTILHNIGLPIV